MNADYFWCFLRYCGLLQISFTLLCFAFMFLMVIRRVCGSFIFWYIQWMRLHELNLNKLIVFNSTIFRAIYYNQHLPKLPPQFFGRENKIYRNVSVARASIGKKFQMKDLYQLTAPKFKIKNNISTIRMSEEKSIFYSFNFSLFKVDTFTDNVTM